MAAYDEVMADRFEALQGAVEDFSSQRHWDQFHTPKNLILALSSELGELAELVQWKSDTEVADFLATPAGKQRFSEEIADIAIYLIRLCQRENLDFIDIVTSKMTMNAAKYPVEKSKGSAMKYTEFDQ